jgi:hypothetical protein
MKLFTRITLASTLLVSGAVAFGANPLGSTVRQVVVSALDVSEGQALTFPITSVNSPLKVVAPADTEAGIFTVTGTVGTTYKLELAPATLTLNRVGGGTDTITVNTFNTDKGLSTRLTLAANGDAHRLGATRAAVGAIQPGTYEGDITLTAVLSP